MCKYEIDIDFIYDKLKNDNEAGIYFKKELINFLKESIKEIDLNNFLNKDDIIFVRDCLITARDELLNPNKFEKLIDMRCVLWDKHDKAQGRKKDFFRALIYVMYADIEEVYNESNLYELIANVIIDLSKIDKRYAKDFINTILIE